MTKYSTFFSDQVRLVRFDGHAANDYIPLGSNINLSWASGTNTQQTSVAPDGAVAFYLSVNPGTSGTIRFTIDSSTVPSSTVGFSSTGGMMPIAVNAGATFRAFANAHTTTSYANLQWLGSV